MLVSQENYAQREQRESPYTVRMLLTIRHFHSKDDGRYRCLSKNTYGESDSTIRLYGNLNYQVDNHITDLIYTMNQIRNTIIRNNTAKSNIT